MYRPRRSYQRRKLEWLVFTLLTPMPVFRSHVGWNPDNPGPLWPVGSKWYHPSTSENRTYLEHCAKFWAERGYEFEITTEVR